MTHWKKNGLIFSPEGKTDWSRSHAQLPTPLHLGENTYRIFFATRDNQNRSHVSFSDFQLSADGSARLARQSDSPILEPGPLGHFDDHGIYPSSIVEKDGKLFMYTIGWSPGVPAPLFYAAIGLAVSEDGGESFRKITQAPILGRNEVDPWMCTSPFVLFDGGKFRMWYTSGLGWEEYEGALESRYHVKYAESTDGIHWTREGLVAIPLLPGEKNTARPWVLHEKGRYRMWFSYNRGPGYRIGYAESTDGLAWERKDETGGLNPSPEGFDSEICAYPAVVRHNGRLFLFYNGNGYGREGFGLAVE